MIFIKPLHNNCLEVRRASVKRVRMRRVRRLTRVSLSYLQRGLVPQEMRVMHQVQYHTLVLDLYQHSVEMK